MKLYPGQFSTPTFGQVEHASDPSTKEYFPEGQA